LPPCCSSFTCAFAFGTQNLCVKPLPTPPAPPTPILPTPIPPTPIPPTPCLPGPNSSCDKCKDGYCHGGECYTPCNYNLPPCCSSFTCAFAFGTQNLCV
jgi:hypothetical protein